ncbi:MAG: hypothetical protein ACRDPD_20850, partial [Streptosporangiaceae bacterium]
ATASRSARPRSCSRAQARACCVVASSVSSHRAAASSPALVCPLLAGLREPPGAVGPQGLQHQVTGPAVPADPGR